MDQLRATTSTDWTTIPKELTDWVAVIEELDQTSTFFRYPGAGDAFKSDFKELSIAEICSGMGSRPAPVKVFVESDENDDVVGAFRMDSSYLKPVKDTLKATASELSTLHFAFRCELAGGT